MKTKYLFRTISLLVLMLSIVPVIQPASAAASPPPADMFQLPWDQGIAWVAIDGIDNGTKRPLTSSHNYSVGGAIDFAPHNNMKTGEDTSNFWVAAAASGKVVEISGCHMKIAHDGGWITEYQFLGNIKVKLGDTVERNQRLGIIADGIRQKYCPGYVEPNVPHVHFMLRPTLIGATFAGWQVKYNSGSNITTFTKDGTTVGLYKPLLNTMGGSSTSSPTPTMTTSPSTATPTAPSGPYVSTSLNLPGIDIGGSALATVRLNNVPVEGYTSAEFTCTYNASLVEAGNIAIADLFGADPATAISGPQNGSFIVAIAGSNANRATTSGIVFTFDVKGLQAGQTALECTARVSQGNNVLSQIPSVGTSLAVFGPVSPTPTITQSPAPLTPTIPPSICDLAEFIADINVPPGTAMLPGQQFTKTWRLKNVGTCDWTTSYQIVFVSGAIMSAPTPLAFPMNVAPGQTIDVSINMTAPYDAGLHRGYWMFRNANGALFGIGPQVNEPWFVEINVSGPTVTPAPPTNSPTPTITMTTTPPAGEWLAFTNLTYGFEFKYPPQGVIAEGRNDNFARIDLPFVQGTNLREKYLEVIARENVNLCQSPLATTSMLESSETVVVNGITFLKQTGQDGGAGHLHQWVAYSTARGNACVSLDFILHSLNPGNFPTPPPVFDYAAESAVFGQIVSTYAWLAQSPTATPTFTTTPVPSATSAPDEYGIVDGRVIAGKPVTVSFLDANNAPVGSVGANPDGTFGFSLLPGTYTALASADGFLGAQGSVTVTAGNTATMPTIELPAGDIDSNNVIDQFDALTIGINYNASTPAAADLNNDGVINVLDLELLASNYRKTGPVVWQ
ncbi:MAG: hypothetical protein C3F07_09635 [Anaerolineales bacterium]|nr:hypothetical protein [Anaerolineae bacterium]PWB73360.1 MAG: hypothetical protein C3F07_09635 [Anaerolineales bacterium]